MSKVMLVEDDNNLREIYEARLQAEGYTIVSARDGEEALVIAKQEQPDLIISDVMMPKISGFEMLDILRNTDGLRDTKVIMLTALGQSDDQQRADKLGADRYLVKSQVTLEDIVKVTHDLLGDTPAPAAGEAPPTDTPASPPTASSAASTGTGPAVAAPAPSAPAIAVEPPPTEPAAEPAAANDDTPAPASDDGSTAAAAVSSPFSPVEVPAEEDTPDTPEVAAVEPTTGAAAAAPEATGTENLTVQSAAQEEASVEAKIEDFVAGASSEATLPSAEPATAEPTAAEPAAAETPTVTAAEPAEVAPVTPIEVSETATATPADAAAITSASDDKLMADAVNTLVGSTQDPPAPTETVSSPVISSAQSGATTTTSAPPEAPAPPVDIEAVPTETVGDGTTIAHKKIIKPIDSEPKQDLDVLLAKEAALQAATQPPAAPSVVVATNEAGPVAPQVATEPGKVDPNSIAL